MSEYKNNSSINENKIIRSKVSSINKNKSDNKNSFNKINIDKSIRVIINNAFENKKVDSMNNMKNRTELKNRIGKKIKVFVYGIGKLNNHIRKTSSGEDVYLYTVINVHEQSLYLSDHLNISIPVNLYKDDFNNKVLSVEGLVYGYNDNKKQTILASKINIINQDQITVNKAFLVEPISIDSNVELKDIIKTYGSLSNETKIRLMLESIKLLDFVLEGNLPNKFITNYILNQYMLNYSPDLINREDVSLIQHKVKSAAEISMINYSIIYKLIKGDILTIYDLFIYINECLNIFQGINEEIITLKFISKKNSKSIMSKRFIDFCDRVSVKYYQGLLFAMLRQHNFKFIKYKNIDENKIMIEGLSVLYANNYEIL